MSSVCNKPDHKAGGNAENRAGMVPMNALPIEPREESISPRASFQHPEWIMDRATSGTAPESTRIAMGRQFARTLGVILAKNTATTAESVDALKEALTHPMKVSSSDRHLYAAIDVVTKSFGYDHATKNMAHHMNSALDGVPLSEKLSVTAALMRETVVRMFSDMLDAPSMPGSLMSMSGDQSMCTVFGVRGDVEKMSVTMLRGHLSSAFKDTLEEAHQKYQDKKAVLREGGAIKRDDVFELKLTIDGTTSTFKTTKDDLIESYTTALMKYASVKYADRMRQREGKALENGHS